VHVDPAQAVQAHLDIGPVRSVAMHFGTFQLTDEGIDAPAEELHAAREGAGLPADAFQVPVTGGTLTF
jgi:L-ascorbate metabolism protein UlaG (beta-lactamase superfamily)